MNETLILKSRPVVESLNDKHKALVGHLKSKNINPSLTVVIVGDDPASHVYVRRKGQACEKLGIVSDTIALPADTPESALLDLITKLNSDKSIHGILVQSPMPKQINEDHIILAIDPKKDVDCFHPHNVGLLVSGNPYMQPCTPAGIVEILKYYKISPEGKHVVVMGRSNIVGKPMANLLVQKKQFANATVTVVHSRTNAIGEYTKQADILIAAIGQPHFVTNNMVKEGAVVIDVGMNRIDADNEKGYALVGDVKYDEVFEKVSAITPVPGGVGPMTIAMLMENTITAAAQQGGITLD
ncbi:MAG: bifunctional 5,10-methylene-tetrahydrofolate dehydrogenase/5,10-methylene-tetrahydrofolate cyclohydrolase [Calditrichaceae bacterium]|nr:bifunctional 5,10-methylene-tetrahydrofolate dehydrogenase/5,10-methylene-tetrahydrofolate cyclohydrolase [Calditrichaceae bacterium]